jgi:hypothetical protein
MIIGPSAAPESVNDRKVPTAVPSEESAYSNAYVMVAGARIEVHVPQRIPTMINMERVSEKESIIMATSPTERNVRMILSLLQASNILPPRIRPAIIIMATAEKKSPGLLTPL